MGYNALTNSSSSRLNQRGQDNVFLTNSDTVERIIYPAIVKSVDDAAGFNRIRVRIVDFDDQGNVSEFTGRDRDFEDDQLPLCIPLLPEFVHVRPKVGECVMVICENPRLANSLRFWIGPVITSQLKLSNEAYDESQRAMYASPSFDKKEINNGPTLQKQDKQASVLATQTEIAFQGRQDADVVLRPRALEIRAGSFKLNSTTELNTTTPCRILLKQVDSNPNLTGVKSVDEKLSNEFVPFSQQIVVATNINIYSPEGKFRTFDSNDPENTTNPRLKDFGSLAQSLHPAVFGDELIKLLKLILQYLLFHIHTPQNPPLANNISDQLQPYLNSGKMQDIVSNVIRIN